ncbi:hypothetical protein IAD21_00010 [Abditibacteriota bacterium]|nr:hypothetical protein IAD21_00010 [Abditibacteriota bacterium]
MFSRAVTFLRTSYSLEILLFLFILCFAGWLRFENLALLPNGFFGDEAVAGFEGQRIFRVGYIGPYSPGAWGQPAGPLYLTALSVGFFGPTVWAVRAVSALLGTLTVAVLYCLLRRHANVQGHPARAIALIGALLLATLNWHLHFSRMGFPVIAWPLCTLLATWAALEAVRHRQARWWAITGFLAGLGIYSYNGHSLCIIALGAWLLFYLDRPQQREVVWSWRLAWLLSFCGLALLAVLPMMIATLDPRNRIFAYARLVSVFSSPYSKWSQLEGHGQQLAFLARRYFSFWDNLSYKPRFDTTDGTGVIPVVPLLMLIVAFSGLVLCWKTRRSPLVEISAFYCLIMPLSPMLTLGAFDRRAFALAPFLIVLTVQGFVEFYRLVNEAIIKGQGPQNRRVVALRVALLCCLTVLYGAITYQNLNGYFIQAMPSKPVAWFFAHDLTETCHYLNRLPPDAHVYFYSARWSCDYETRRFLAPNVSIEDRSKEFGTFSFSSPKGRAKPYFVLLGHYKSRLTELQRLYPHSHIQSGPLSVDGQPTFIALHPNT